MLAVTLDRPQSFPLLITRLVLTLKRHEWAFSVTCFMSHVGLWTASPHSGPLASGAGAPVGRPPCLSAGQEVRTGCLPGATGCTVSLPTTGAAGRGLRGRGQLGTAQQLPTPFLYRLRQNFKHHGENWTKLNGGEA